MANQPKKYKKFVATAATATLVASAIVPVASAEEAKFSDMVNYDAETIALVEDLADKGIITGDQGKFNPQGEVSRKHAVLMIGRFLKDNGVTGTGEAEQFEDVSSADAEFAELALLLRDLGIFKGNNGKLEPSKKFTREQMADVMDRLYKEITGKSMVETAEEKGLTGEFTDTDSIKEEARAAALAAKALGLSTVDTFNPKGAAKRVHFAKFLYVALPDLEAALELTVEEALAALEAAVKALPAEVTKENATDAQAAVDEVKAAIVALEEVAGEEASDEVKAAIKAAGEEADKTQAAIDALEVKELTVESVSAINANEIKVVFNTTVDGKTAELADNYEVELNGSIRSSLNFELQEDGKTVLIRNYNTAFTAGDKIVVQVKDGIKSTEGKNVERFTTDTIVFGATAAPQLVGTPKLTSNGLVFTFDRPVSEAAQTLVKIDGVALADTYFEASTATGSKITTASDLSPGDYHYVVDLTTAETTAASKAGNHEVVVFDVYETARLNPEKNSVINTTYTVEKDVTAPEVVGIKAVNANRFFIEFTEPVTLDSTFANSITVKKGNLQFTTVTSSTVGASNNTHEAYVSAATTYQGKPGVFVVVDDEPVATTTNKLYDTNDTSVTLNVTVEKYQDAVELLGKKYEGTVTLSKNTATPVVSDQVVKTTGSKELQFLFNGKLNGSTSTILTGFNGTLQDLDGDGSSTDRVFNGDSTKAVSSYIVVKDKDGIVVPDQAIISISLGNELKGVTTYTDRVVNVQLASNYNDRGPYTVTFKKDAVQFATETTAIASYNAEATKNKEFNVTLGTAAESAAKYYALNNSPSVSGNVISLYYGVDMTDSATNVANYTLDGKALPAGSKVNFYGDKKQVQITLPAGTLTSTTDYKLTVSKNVTTAAGQTVVGDLQKLNAYEATLSNLKDNTRPVLASAEYLVTSNAATTTNRILVKFSENVQAGDLSLNKDLKVVVNGNTVAVTAISDAKANDEYIILNLDTTVNLLQGATISVLPLVAENETAVIQDLEGNKLNASTVTTAGSTLDAMGNASALAPAVGLTVSTTAPGSLTVTVTDTADLYEYRKAGSTAWTQFTATTNTETVTGLSAGTYEVRKAATTSVVASAAQSIQVYAAGSVAAKTVTSGSATETELNTFFSGLGTQLVGKTLPTVSVSGTTITLDGTLADTITGVTAFPAGQDSGKYAVYKIAAPADLNANSAALTSGGTNILDADNSGVTFVQRLADATYSAGWTSSGSEYTKTVDIFFKNAAGTEVKVTYTLISK